MHFFTLGNAPLQHDDQNPSLDRSAGEISPPLNHSGSEADPPLNCSADKVDPSFDDSVDPLFNRPANEVSPPILATKHTDFSLFIALVMSSSLHIEFQELYWSIFIVVSLITTNPYLNVISGGRGQLYIEPYAWW